MTTTTTAATDTGHSTGALVATGLLSFGAGMLVANIFDDDDDDWYKKGYYNPRYYGPSMPYYPPYPYRPSYGNGYYPSNGYNRPPGYGGGFNNSGNIVVVNPGGNNAGYWDRYDNNRSGYNGATRDGQSRNVSSPITAAKPNRPELNSLNAQAKARAEASGAGRRRLERPEFVCGRAAGHEEQGARCEAGIGLDFRRGRAEGARLLRGRPGEGAAPGARRRPQHPQRRWLRNLLLSQLQSQRRRASVVPRPSRRRVQRVPPRRTAAMPLLRHRR